MRSVASSPFGIAASVAVAILLWPAAAMPASDGEQDLSAQPRETYKSVSNDDRRRIVDARAAAYAAVGRFTGTMTCTAAVIVHPRIIVTAGHCVANRNGRIRPSKLIFQPGYQAGTDLGQLQARVWAVGTTQMFGPQSVQDASNDWAILLLERAPVGIRPFLLSNRSKDTLMQLGQQILMPSYSIDIAAAQSLSVDPACSVLGLVWNVLIHDCKASYGGSGAPLLIRQNRWFAVVGIHSGSILARDEESHAMKLIGQEAIGAWTFADAAYALLSRLKSVDDPNVVAPLAH